MNTHTLITILAAGLLTAAGLLPGSVLAADEIRLPDMGSRASSVLSRQEEQELGDEYIRALRKQVDIIDDPEVAGYIQDLGYRLVSNSQADNTNFTFFVVNEPSINAFAVPGGYVGVNSGLILMTASESELASVLAHEIAHITQRHIARMFEAQNQLTIPAIAALAAAVLVGTQNSEAGMAAFAATQAGLVQAGINFTRANEQEADRIGIETLARAGFNPRAMPGMFEKMQNATRYYGHPPEYLSTHPVTEARIAEAQSRAESLPNPQTKPSFAFQMTRMKLRVLAAADPGKLLKTLEQKGTPGTQRESHVLSYGYALALKRAGRLDQAAELFRGLSIQHPEYIPFIAELADTELQRNRDDTAHQILSKALALYPENPALVESLARTLLRQKQAEKARQLLKNYASHHAMNARLYKLLARSEDQAGNPVEASLAMAEYYYQQGELPAAIDLLTRAQKKVHGDFYLASRVDARLEEMMAESGDGAPLGVSDPQEKP